MNLSVMLMSICSPNRSGDITVAEACTFLREECDIDAIEPMNGDVLAVGAGEFGKMLDGLGQHIACYIASGDFVQKTDAQQQPAIDAVKAAIDNSLALGCKLVLVTTGMCKPDIPGPEARKRIAAGLRKVILYARDQGVTIAIEDVGVAGAPYGTSQELLEMLELTGPDLSLTYDNGNFFTHGEDPDEALDRVWEKVVHIHLKDWRKLADDEESRLVCMGDDGARYQGVACGTGLLDYPSNLAHISRLGYDGYLSFEYEGVEDPKAAARTGLTNIRSLLQAQGNTSP